MLNKAYEEFDRLLQIAEFYLGERSPTIATLFI